MTNIQEVIGVISIMMKFLLTMLLLSCCISSSVFANNKVIIFNMKNYDHPPYMMHGATNSPGGIMYDVLNIIATKHGYTIDLVGVPKTREDRMLKVGAMDAQAIAKEWVKSPDDYVFTDVIIDYRDVIFSNKEAGISHFDVDNFIGKIMITHLGYSYPLLSPYFNSGKITRMDTLNEESMLGMLAKKRANAAVVNELTGRWLIKQNQQWQDRFVISENDVDSVGYRIMFSKKWAFFIPIFNEELSRLKAQGRLAEIIAKYQ